MKEELKIYNMTFKQFKSAAKQCHLIQSTEQSSSHEEQYAKTFITMGYANKYSDKDIAHFYAIRVSGFSSSRDHYNFKTAYNFMLCDAYREGFINSLQLKYRLQEDGQ